jgi:hypothetical protein
VAKPAPQVRAGGPPFDAAQAQGLRLYGCRVLRFLKGADFDSTLFFVLVRMELARVHRPLSPWQLPKPAP